MKVCRAGCPYQTHPHMIRTPTPGLAVTTVRPPQHVVDIIERNRAVLNLKRSAYLRVALDRYVSAPSAPRLLVLPRSKATDRPLPMSLSEQRLAHYRRAAAKLSGGSLTRLVTLAVESAVESAVENSI